eukprot:CAMPEP_0204896580 /NCGR_PEP_ID=MMETSP1397-20131031/240_1 /ASSEMBLY_ACC=CAM_ASM_000891 /TAXON_ID=49980 /ORGANISM="Climacostomum Climacostomum virens, Strain Stock W-24" /LENGTH=848 /DNA_ID=CAMNT_0052064211 /DNA_START=618 /DNA_END=3164 /DNA_ORIENTATION=+
MGNNNSQLILWDNLINKLNEQAGVIRESCILNPETSKEYLLKKQLRPNCFLAASENEDFEISFISCENFDKTKAVTLTAKKLSLLKSSIIEPVFDYFAFKETGFKKLNVAVIMRNTQGVIAEDWVRADTSKPQVEYLLEAFFTGLEEIRSIHEEGGSVGFISTHTLEIFRGKKSLNYRLKYTTDHIEHGQLPPEGNRYTEQADVWGAGYILFTMLTRTPSRESQLGHKSEHERLSYIRHKLGDLGVCEVLAMCLCDVSTRKTPSEILSHKFVRWWRHADFTELRLDLVQALNTQLKFTADSAKQTAYKAFFQLATLDAPNIFSFIQLQNYDWQKLVVAFMNMQLEVEASEGAIQLFITALKHTKGTRRLLLKEGIAEYLLRRTTTIEFSTLMAFFIEICKKATCSIPVLLYERKVHMQAFKNYWNDMYSQNFITSTAPYFGNYSVKLILQACEQEFWNNHQSVEMLLKVPYQNLHQHKQAILELIEDCVDTLIVSNFNFSSCLLNALKLLSSVTSVAEVFEHSSQRGSCLSSPEFAFAVELSRCPLVIFCSDCAIPVCTFCGATCHSSCKLRPLYPQSKFKSCQCVQKHEASLDHYPVFKLRKRSQYQFKTSSQAIVEMADNTMFRITTNNYYGEPINVVSHETLLAREHYEGTKETAFYYEVKILSTGPRDALTIGLEDLQYQSWNGHIVNSDHTLVRRAVPYGSHDFVGVGITHDQRVYFTLNGLMIHPLLPLTNDKLKIAFQSEDASVLLIFDPGRCLFQPKDLSLLDDLRVRAMESIPPSLIQKLERMLSENYSYFEEEQRLEDLYMFLSRQFSGQIGHMFLSRAMRTTAWGDQSCIAIQCALL